MRFFDAGFSLLLVLTAGACATAADATESGAGAATDGNDWDRAVTRPASESSAATDRAACKFERGALPAETLGAELPIDTKIPIETIVVIMQENRSFDSYFGHLNQYAHRTDIESAKDDASNPERIDQPNPKHAWQHAKTLCIADTNHEWAGSHLELNGGKMDGFFQANNGYRESGQPEVDASLLNGERALWWYDERDIPFYYDLATTFAIADHYHSSVVGPTFPNRDYLYAATSRGVTTGHAAKDIGRARDNVLIFDELDKRGISWAVYVDQFPHAARVGAFTGGSYIDRWQGQHFLPTLQFKSDAARGLLPAVVFVDASITEDAHGNDEHPPGDIQNGQKFVSDRIGNLFASPQWKSMAIFVTYDEHGGLYDHVAPPKACPPDDIEPVLENGDDRAYPGRFDQLGMRVPFIAVSPFSKPAHVSHKTYDHTSITRFIEAKFKLPALTRRDANADPLFDLFDFSKPTFLTPPKLAEAVVDPVRYSECLQLFAPPASSGGGG